MAALPGSMGEVGAWTPRTKYLRPPVGQDVVLDPALVGAVRNAIESTRLTLLSAQAGAGKTTLAAAVLDSAPELRAAWISLDGGDDDLDSLLHLLAGAIEQASPGSCPSFQDLLRLRLPAAADPRRAIGVLVNDLLAMGGESLLLVLDDLDALRDPAVSTALDYLLAYAPPGVRVLATVRGDPHVSRVPARAGAAPGIWRR